eukprot:Seg1549.6 transcript_id=Seg1549.6/GoldUCD/mRNA.D3Y31 product="hypothetical protein" protein_id=Seg1549.6/GoldUCD/D3Y31
MAEPISILGFAATELATMACLVLAALLEICAAAVNNWQMTEVKDKNGSFKATMGLFKWCETIATKPYPAVETCTSIVWNAKGSTYFQSFFTLKYALKIHSLFLFLRTWKRNFSALTIVGLVYGGVTLITYL